MHWDFRLHERLQARYIETVKAMLSMSVFDGGEGVKSHRLGFYGKESGISPRVWRGRTRLTVD